MEDLDAILVQCTIDTPQQATELAEILVDAQACACVNIVPGLQSIYRWQGQIEHDSETLLLIKTTQAGYAQLEALIQQHHPYDVPEIIALPISHGSKDYLTWLSQQVS